MYKIKLSPYHKIFYNEWKVEPNSYKYNIVFDQTFDTNLNVITLRSALHRFISEHLIFNSHITKIDEELYWVKNVNINELEFFESDRYVSHKLSQYATAPFNLENGCLYRFAVFSLGKGGYRLVIVLHHILIDGNAFDEFVQSISQYYNDNLYQARLNLNDQEKSLYAFVDKLNHSLILNAHKYKHFWQNLLSGAESADLRFLRSGMANSFTDHPVKTIEFSLSGAIIPNLKKVADIYEITPYLYSQCIFALLLYRYTNQNKFVISYPIAIKDSIHLIGASQINTNFLVFDFSKIATIEELFNEATLFVKSLVKNNIKYNSYPIFNILEGRNNNLLDVVFAQTNLKNMPFNFKNANILRINSELYVDLPSKLVFEQQYNKNCLSFRIKYDIREVDEIIIQTFTNQYKKLFYDVINDTNNNIATKPLYAYKILDKLEYDKIVSAWNQTSNKYPDDKTIHQIFEEQVFKTPDKIALACYDTQLTYQELNTRANKLAHHLSKVCKINPDDLIALFLDKSEHLIISILAILKSGAAYVPIDVNNPNNRIKYILNDTQVKILLTTTIKSENISQILADKLLNQSETINSSNCTIISIDTPEFISQLNRQNSTNTAVHTYPNNLAYVIYTSGTTGQPKGVLIEHRNVISLVKGITYIDIKNTHRFILLANIGFDAATFEIWSPLLNGACLFIPKDELELISDVYKFKNYLRYNNISTLWLTKTLFDKLYSLEGDIFNTLEYLLVGGEILNKTLIDRLATSNHRPVNLINGYGATENTTFSTSYNITNNVVQYINSVPIGTPLTNRTCYILDKYLQPLPIGAIGELYVGGDGLCRGYLNQPALTKEKFINLRFKSSDSFTPSNNIRLYKTGDLARWLPNGILEYIGREDSQIKINGYRIELDEIKNKLLTYPKIQDAIVMIGQNDVIKDYNKNNVIFAYYLSNVRLNEIDILDYLNCQLPYYMVPSFLIHLSSIPLTLSGKLNKDKLPKPNLYDNNFIMPQNDVQYLLVDLWSKVINIPKEKISITDSFFKLGGNSMLINKLKRKLSNIPKLEFITIADLFKFHTIKQLTDFISCNKTNQVATSFNKQKVVHNDENIAIIGLSGAFSGCKDINQYWDIIQNGNEGVHEFSKEECKQQLISDSIIYNKNFIPVSGHISDIDKFDCEFWGISPEEAKSFDPQIRKFVEHCWYLLEDSGYLVARNKINIAIYAGSGNSNYTKLISSHNETNIGSRQIENLSAKDALVTRTSYLLGLIGTAANINTACSTSLVSVVEACKSLSSGYCDMAIAGGVSLLLPNEIGHIYQEGSILSQDKHCRVFDKRSSGIIQGSGVGVVLLKRLSDAERDKDNIIAVIKGYATNNDGSRKMTYTSPSVIGQSECIINAQKVANISSNLVSYIECHGTGTAIGDPIEIKALYDAFKHNTNVKTTGDKKCFIGSVKANVGHTDIASGIAGLIKVCKMLKHKIIPKQINFEEANPEINIQKTNFMVPTTTQFWNVDNDLPRIAGVSSFGIGGTNAHIIVSEYIPQNIEIQYNHHHTSSYYVLPFSAKSRLSLQHYKNEFINYLESTPHSIAEIAYTLQTKRDIFPYRTCVIAKTHNEAIHKLKNIVTSSYYCDITPQNIIFCFPGQGNQYANMSYNLYQNEPYYRETVDYCIQVANKYSTVKIGNVLFSRLFGQNEAEKINQTQYTQICLFIVSYSLAKLLEKIAIKPVAYIGHSIGEWVAATLSGVFKLEDAIKLVIARGQLMQNMQSGCMLAIDATYSSINSIIKDNNCEISVINSPANVVVSGTIESIQSLKHSLAELNIESSILRVSHAYHSHFMMAAAKQFVSEFADIRLSTPTTPFVSNITGKFITDNEAINPVYWSSHIQSPVLFADGITTLFGHYHDSIFIEVGAGKSSLSFIKQNNVKSHKIMLMQLLNSYKDELANNFDLSSKEEILAKLWLNGCEINFIKYDKNIKHYKTVILPHYHFEYKSYWINEDRTVPSNLITSPDTDLKSKIIEKNLPSHYYQIAQIFIDVLGVEQISIYDDFFEIGGDSFLAVNLVAQIQRNFDFHMHDLFKLRTINKIAESIVFVSNNLQTKIEKIKAWYSQHPALSNLEMSPKYINYINDSNNIKVVINTKCIQNVLLTGATGHLGCNILNKLLLETSYNVYLLIRDNTVEDAYNRLRSQFMHYFETELEKYRPRLKIFLSDIEQEFLGLSPSQYELLTLEVDSIIHSAALARHYGEYSKFYAANVKATQNLLELALLTKGKDFHYISTIAVLLDGVVTDNYKQYIFSEDDDASMLKGRGLYASTKYEGELMLHKYRQKKVNCNVYRPGNIAMHSQTYKHQLNIQDNAFFITMKTFLEFGIIARELSVVEISPVDYVALAIVKIFDQASLSNGTYHIVNHNLCNLIELFNSYPSLNLKVNDIAEFMNTLLIKLENGSQNQLVGLFMLHQLWLRDIECFTNIKALQKKTDVILEQLGFKWPVITPAMLSGIISLANSSNTTQDNKIFN